MLKIQDYRIVRDGENAAVYMVTRDKDKEISYDKDGNERMRVVAYVRDLQGALLSVQRKMSVTAFEKEHDIHKLMTLLEQQQEELIQLVKVGCTDCLGGSDE
jgi:hypothetical protein